MKSKKSLSLFMILVLMTNLLVGCGQGGGEKSYTITEEKPIVEGKGVNIKFSEYDINEKTKIKVSKVEPQNIFSEEVSENDVKIEAFEIKAEEIDKFTDLIEIRIPYDDSFIEVGNVEKNIGAMYFDEELGEWTPVYYELDKTTKEVVILTNHLSTYSAYTIKNENSRAARIIAVSSYPTLPDGASDDFEAVIEEAMSNQMTPGQKARELGLTISGDWLGISGAGLTAITQTVYATEFVNGLSNAFTNVGLAAAFVQAAHDFSKGDDTALFGNLTKNLSYFSVSKWGSNALQLGFVGVFAIDYSLNKFANAAWDGRKEIWYEAYRRYYSEENKMTNKQWYNKFYWLWQDTKASKDPNALKNAINQSLDQYVKAFWDMDETDQAFWVSEVQKTGFSGGGGLNEKLKKDISDAAKAELVATLQETVFNRLEQSIRFEMMEAYRKELIDLKNYLNKVTKVLITENVKAGEKSEYANHIVRFSPLSDNVNKANWTGKIKEDGTANTSFTALGHIQSGAPDKLLLFKPDANPDTDEPIKEIPFKINFPNTQINLKELNPTMDEIVGAWSEVYMTFPNMKIETGDKAAGDEECDMSEEIAEFFRVAKLKCKFEIIKIDEENAKLIFGFVSGVNKETGESLEMEPGDPITGTATYKEGKFVSTISVDGSTISFNLNMKKDSSENIYFSDQGKIVAKDEEYGSGTIEFHLEGKK